MQAIELLQGTEWLLAHLRTHLATISASFQKIGTLARRGKKRRANTHTYVYRTPFAARRRVQRELAHIYDEHLLIVCQDKMHARVYPTSLAVVVSRQRLLRVNACIHECVSV